MKDSSTAPPPVPCRLHHGALKCHHNRKIKAVKACESNVKTIWNHNRKWKNIVAHCDSPLGELSSGAECLDLRNWWAAQCASLMESTGPKRRLHPPTANARQMVTWEYTRRLCLAPCCCEQCETESLSGHVRRSWAIWTICMQRRFTCLQIHGIADWRQCLCLETLKPHEETR